MNEPSDFVDQTGKNQIDVVSYDEGEKSTHAKNRNVFALLMARATYEGLERLQPDRRPYVITRAAYAGIQRYSTMWTGDTNSTWESLALNIPMFTSLGLSGEPFVGSDVGGFIGRGNGELLTAFLSGEFPRAVLPQSQSDRWLRSGTVALWEVLRRHHSQVSEAALPVAAVSLHDSGRGGGVMAVHGDVAAGCCCGWVLERWWWNVVMVSGPPDFAVADRRCERLLLWA